MNSGKLVTGIPRNGLAVKCCFFIGFVDRKKSCVEKFLALVASYYNALPFYNNISSYALWCYSIQLENYLRAFKETEALNIFNNYCYP